MRRIIKRNNKIVCNIRDEINLNKFLDILKEWFVEDWTTIEVKRVDEEKKFNVLKSSKEIIKKAETSLEPGVKNDI